MFTICDVVLPSVAVKKTEVNYEEGAFKLARQLFGRQPADVDLAHVAGALDGATVNASVKNMTIMPDIIDYLAMIHAQCELRRDTEEKARREGYELGAPQIELTPADETILDRVWAKRATEKAVAEVAERADDEDAQLTPARAA